MLLRVSSPDDFAHRIRSMWPEASIDARFARHFEKLGAKQAHLLDCFLAWACAEHQPWALLVFERDLLPKAVVAARSVDKSGGLDDEIRSRLRALLLVGAEGRPPRLTEYAGTGPLENWVRSVAIRTALNLVPRRKPADPLEAAEHLAGPDAELEFLKKTYREQFKRAFQAALAKLPADELTLLRLHVIEHLSIDQLSAMYQIHRATAARRIGRARERLCDITREELARQIGLDGQELESVMRLVRSNVDVSISRLLRT